MPQPSSSQPMTQFSGRRASRDELIIPSPSYISHHAICNNTSLDSAPDSPVELSASQSRKISNGSGHSNNNTSGNGYPGTLARSTSLAKRSVQRNLGRKNSVSSIDNTEYVGGRESLTTSQLSDLGYKGGYPTDSQKSPARDVNARRNSFLGSDYGDEEKKKKKKKKKIIGFDKTRPSTLPCFPKMKFHVFCKDSPQMIVHPDAELYKRWSKFITMLVVYNAISAPLRFAFTNSDTSSVISSTTTGSLRLEFTLSDMFETIVDLCFFFDVVVQFRLAYFVYGTLVTDPQRISLRYVKMKFWTDLLATVPLDYFSPALRFTGLLRLIRMTRLLELFSSLEKNFEVNYIAICLIKFLTLLLVCSHWAGCGFFFLASQLDFNADTWVGNVVLSDGCLKDEPWTTQYVYSVYWAVTTLTTVGYGDISPESGSERMYTMLVMLFNMGVTAYILGNMTLIATKSDAATAEFRTVMTSLSEMLHRKQVPEDLRQAALGQVQLTYDMQDERDDALKHCPPFVRNQILRFLYNATIANSYLLEDTTTTLVDTLTNFVQLEFFFPDTPLIEPFQMPASLFFIVEGTVEMTDEGAALRLLKEGDTFGEEAVLCNVTTPLEYKTVSFCRVLLLDRMELNSVLEKMPAEHRVVQKNVLKQLEAWMAEEKTNLARAMELDHTLTDSHGKSKEQSEQDLSRKNMPWPEVGSSITADERLAWGDEVALIERRVAASGELCLMVQSSITRGQQDMATRLCYLALRNEKEAIRHILADPSVDPNVADYHGRTALHLSALHGHMETVLYLIERGANPSVRDSFGITPLWEATRKFHQPIMKLLLEYGAEIGLEDAAYTVCNAASKANAPLVRALCQSGIDVNCADYDGRTCIHLAASDGVFVIVQIQLEFKANVNVMDRWNNTPLDDAMRGKHEQIVALLIAHGGKQGSVVKQEAADDKERELKRELDSLREQEEKARELSEEAKHPKPTDATSEEEDTDPLCRQLSTQSEDWVPALSEAWSRSSPAQFAADGSDGSDVKKAKRGSRRTLM